MLYNNELQFIDSCDKAYLYGLLFADGNVYWKIEEKRGSVNLSLSIKDKELITKILNLFPFFSMVEYKRLLRLYCYSPICTKHVAAYMPERKSYENKEMLTLSSIPKEHLSSFFRGFFDGDGHIKAHSGTSSIEISCVSHGFIRELETLLQSLGIKTSLRIRVPKRNKDKQIMYRLYIFSHSIELLYQFMYKDANIYMLRKKQEFDNVFLYRDNKFMLCPICKLKSLTKYGTKKGKQRYYCKSCKKYSTGSAPLNSNV